MESIHDPTGRKMDINQWRIKDVEGRHRCAPKIFQVNLGDFLRQNYLLFPDFSKFVKGRLFFRTIKVFDKNTCFFLLRGLATRTY